MKKNICFVDVNTSIYAVAILTARINNVNRHLREGPNYKRVSWINALYNDKFYLFVIKICM